MSLIVTDPKKQRALKLIQQSSSFLDNRFRIPGTQIRFGIDFLIGLVPGVGDVLSFSLSAFLVLVMTRFGASGSVVVKMIGNVLLDALVGFIPLLGDLFDLSYRANMRNLRLLEDHYEEGKHSGNGCGMLLAVALILIAAFAGLLYALATLFNWLGATILGL